MNRQAMAGMHPVSFCSYAEVASGLQIDLQPGFQEFVSRHLRDARAHAARAPNFVVGDLMVSSPSSLRLCSMPDQGKIGRRQPRSKKPDRSIAWKRSASIARLMDWDARYDQALATRIELWSAFASRPEPLN